jgi:hypothetical protein
LFAEMGAGREDQYKRALDTRAESNCEQESG